MITLTKEAEVPGYHVHEFFVWHCRQGHPRDRAEEDGMLTCQCCGLKARPYMCENTSKREYWTLKEFNCPNGWPYTVSEVVEGCTRWDEKALSRERKRIKDLRRFFGLDPDPIDTNIRAYAYPLETWRQILEDCDGDR